MKTLYIVRHGKSSWDYEQVDDIDRPLNERGISDGYKMARRVLKKKMIPELIISSNACRALHTATIFHRVLNMYPGSFMIDSSVYLAGIDQILNVIYGTDDSIDSLMIFGHNPGFTDIANYLSRLDISNVPTTGLVKLDFDIKKWTDVSRNILVAEEFDFPKKS